MFLVFFSINLPLKFGFRVRRFPIWCISEKNQFCRNRTAENLYGFPAAEALGKSPIELLCDPQDVGVAHNIVHRVSKGESWTGQFPVKNKNGERFTAVVTNTPFYDDDGTLVGIICVSNDMRPFQEMKVPMSGEKHPESESNYSRSKANVTAKLSLDPQQPLQTAIASKITNLVSPIVSILV